jgi:hypothetical protein
MSALAPHPSSSTRHHEAISLPYALLAQEHAEALFVTVMGRRRGARRAAEALTLPGGISPLDFIMVTNPQDMGDMRQVCEAAAGHSFAFHVVRPGEVWGATGKAYEGREPLVEVFDADSDVGWREELGLRTVEYHLSTMRSRPAGKGLILHDSVPGWVVHASCMEEVAVWLEGL